MKPHDTATGTRQISGMVKEFFIWPALFGEDVSPHEDKERIVLSAIDIYLARYGA